MDTGSINTVRMSKFKKNTFSVPSGRAPMFANWDRVDFTTDAKKKEWFKKRKGLLKGTVEGFDKELAQLKKVLR